MPKRASSGAPKTRGTSRRGGKAKAVTVVLDAELLEEIEHRAWAARTNRSQAVEEAVRYYLDKTPRPRVTVTTPKKRKR